MHEYVVDVTARCRLGTTSVAQRSHVAATRAVLPLRHSVEHNRRLNPPFIVHPQSEERRAKERVSDLGCHTISRSLSCQILAVYSDPHCHLHGSQLHSPSYAYLPPPRTSTSASRVCFSYNESAQHMSATLDISLPRRYIEILRLAE